MENFPKKWKKKKKTLGKYLVDECKKIFKTNDIPISS